MNSKYYKQLLALDLPLGKGDLVLQLLDNPFQLQLLSQFGIDEKLIQKFKTHYDKLNVTKLNKNNKSHAGSYRQLLSGQVVSDLLGLGNAVLGALLNPTGGICGRKNSRLECCCIPERSFISHHACMHDAYGFCKIHFDIGAGYNYTGGFSLFKTNNSLSGQLSGLFFCLRQKRETRIVPLD